MIRKALNKIKKESDILIRIREEACQMKDYARRFDKLKEIDDELRQKGFNLQCF